MKFPPSIVAAIFSNCAFAAPLPCIGDAAFGQSFGATELKGVIKQRDDEHIYFIPPTLFSPYREFDAAVDKETGRIWFVGGMATFETDAQALLFASNLVDQYEQSPLVSKRVDQTPITTLYTGSGKTEAVLFGDHIVAPSNGLRISIFSIHNTVSVACVSVELEEKK